MAIPGAALSLVRARSRSVELRDVIVGTVTQNEFSVAPAPGQPADLIAGTSGAFLFRGQNPVGMVLEVDRPDLAWALRMDEIKARLARFMGDATQQVACDDPAVPEAMKPHCAPVVPASADRLTFRAVDWAPHPVDGSASPSDMVAGSGPYIAPLTGVIRLEFEAAETVELSRIVIRSSADGQTTFVPKTIRITSDASSGNTRRPLGFARRDMPPTGVLDIKRGAKFARRVTIEISSSWGGGSPVQIDAVEFYK